MNKLIRAALESQITIKPSSKKKGAVRGHRLTCPGSLRPDEKAVDMFKKDPMPGQIHPILLKERETLITEAAEPEPQEDDTVQGLAAALGLSQEELKAELRVRKIKQKLLADGMVYSSAWRGYIEDKTLSGSLSLRTIEYRTSHYRQLEVLHPNLPFSELWTNPQKIIEFIKNKWRSRSYGHLKSSFTELMQWGQDNMDSIYPNAGSQEREVFFARSPSELIKLKSETDPPPRAILTADGLNQLMDEAATNPKYERSLTSFWMDFEVFGRPVTESAAGSSEIHSVYDRLRLLRVEEIILTGGAYQDPSEPDPEYPEGYGYLLAPLNKTRRQRKGSSAHIRDVNLTPRARAYLNAILAPMTKAGWKKQFFINTDAACYSREKTNLMRSINPMVWVEGFDNPMPLSDAEQFANTNDIVRATIVTFLRLILKHCQLMRSEYIIGYLREQMGHTLDSDTMENRYAGKAPVEEALKWWNHRPPPFIYTLDHRQYHETYLPEMHLRRTAKQAAALKKRFEDPKYKAEQTRKQMAGRKRDANGKCVVPAKSLKNLIRRKPSAACVAAGLAKIAKLAKNPKWRKGVTKKSWAKRKKLPSGKYVISPGSLANLAGRRPFQSKQNQDEQKLQHDNQGHHEEVPCQPIDGQALDSVGPAPLPTNNPEMPPLC